MPTVEEIELMIARWQQRSQVTRAAIKGAEGTQLCEVCLQPTKLKDIRLCQRPFPDANVMCCRDCQNEHNWKEVIV